MQLSQQLYELVNGQSGFANDVTQRSLRYCRMTGNHNLCARIVPPHGDMAAPLPIHIEANFF